MNWLELVFRKEKSEQSSEPQRVWGDIWRKSRRLTSNRLPVMDYIEDKHPWNMIYQWNCRYVYEIALDLQCSGILSVEKEKLDFISVKRAQQHRITQQEFKTDKAILFKTPLLTRTINSFRSPLNYVVWNYLDIN